MKKIIIFFNLLVYVFFFGNIYSEQIYKVTDNTSHRLTKVFGIPMNSKYNVGELEGPGVINHIWITAKCVIPQIQGMLILRIWWNNESNPSVEVPLGDFFGVGFGKERKFKSAMVEMLPAGLEEHSALNSYWKMPFKKSARIEIENKSNRSVTMFFIQIDYEKTEKMEDNVMNFHAQYRRENPVKLHHPYTILEAKGKGKYVGTILNYHLLGPGAWVEGAQEFFIDGEKTPSLPGTGSEDYFGHAWGFKFEDNALYHGTSFGPTDNKMTAYRFHIPDPVNFTKSITATIKCHGWDVQDREDDYSSVALWYQIEPHDKFPPFPDIDYEYLEVQDEYRKNPLQILNEKRKNINFDGENLSLKIKEYKESGHFEIDGLGARAFDGDIGTKWCEIENPDKHWLAVDLGEEYNISGFIIINPSAAGDSPGFDTIGFRIEKGYSLDKKWETIVDKNIKSDINNSESKIDTSLIVIKTEQKIKARYLRLYIYKSCLLDSICRIQEFEIWGKK